MYENLFRVKILGGFDAGFSFGVAKRKNTQEIKLSIPNLKKY